MAKQEREKKEMEEIQRLQEECKAAEYIYVTVTRCV